VAPSTNEGSPWARRLPFVAAVDSLLSRIRRCLARQEGIALVAGLGMSVVLGVAGTTAIAYTSSNQRLASYSKAERSTRSLAEAGLSYAISTLYNAGDPTMPGAVPTRTVDVGTGQITYSGTLSEDGTTWTLSGVGRMPNPTGAATIVRSARVRASVGSASAGGPNNAIWNYVYSDDPDGCMTLGNSVYVNVPLYVRGHLCMQNSARFLGYSLQVGGTLQMTNSSSVGSSNASASALDESNPQVHEVHIGGGCRRGTSGPFVTPCDETHGVYAEVADDSAPTGLTKPPVDLAYWYANAQPGPLHGCTTGSFPGGFDTDTTLNRSRGTVNLLPSTAYDCTVRNAQNEIVGRLAWNPTTKVLTIAGTVFFDGNIEFTNSAQAVYEGRATIYASGKITMRNSTQICGIADCTSAWNATQHLLAFVAGSSTDTFGIDLEQSSTFQGAMYAVTDYREGNSVRVWGPIIARQVHLANSAENHYVPLGTLLPGMPQTSTEAITIVTEQGSWSGS
jgi:Tfp pilus assembly protein PilX